jgi:hypothetical protein
MQGTRFRDHGRFPSGRYIPYNPSHQLVSTYATMASIPVGADRTQDMRVSNHWIANLSMPCLRSSFYTCFLTKRSAGTYAEPYRPTNDTNFLPRMPVPRKTAATFSHGHCAHCIFISSKHAQSTRHSSLCGTIYSYVYEIVAQRICAWPTTRNMM